MTNTIQNPKIYLDALTRSKEFLEERSTQTSVRMALGRTATRYFEMKNEKSDYHDIHTLAISLIGQLETLKQASRTLDRHHQATETGQKSGTSREERQRCKRDVVAYNHTIREIIDSNPAMTANEIVDFVAATEMLLGNPEDSVYVTNATREIMTGMQHEIVVEQAVGSMPYADFIDTTIDDDLHGIDVSFMIDGVRYDIDVKASHMGVERKIAQSVGYDTKVIPFWTGLEPGDLGNRFRASDEQVDRVRSRLESALGLAAAEGVAAIA